MKRQFLEWLTRLNAIPRQEENKFSSRMIRIGFVVALCLAQSALAAPQNVPGALQLGAEAQKCAALMQVNF